MDPGDVRKMFRGFFGFQDFQQRENSFQDFSNQPPLDGINGNGSSFDDEEDDCCLDPNIRNSRGFTVFTDPLEIHKYFDQQMDEMLKMFGGSLGFGGIFSQEDGGHDPFRSFGNFNPGLFGQRTIPFQNDEVSPGNSRDHGHARDFMLKEDSQPKIDNEVDWDNINRTDIDKLLKSNEKQEIHDKSHDNSIVPFGRGFNFNFDMNPGENKSFFYGSSTSERTVRRPNGGIESSRTVKNSDGSETVSVTKKIGDQSYSVVTTRDSSGAESSEEKLFNINQSDLEDFKNRFNSKPVQQFGDPRQDMIVGPQSDPTYNKLWDKFFGK